MDKRVILKHVLSFETGMPVARLLSFTEINHDSFLRVRWKGLSRHEDTEDPIYRVFEDVPQLLKILLDRKIPPPLWPRKLVSHFLSKEESVATMK